VDDPYAVLGVGRDATQRDIRRRFRLLALKHHPDRNRGDKGAEATFKRINAAYQILGDPDRGGAFDAGTNRGANPPGTSANHVGFVWDVKTWTTAPTEVQGEPGDGNVLHPPTPEDIAALGKPRRYLPHKLLTVLTLGFFGYVFILAAFDCGAGKTPASPDPLIVDWLKRQTRFGR